MSQEPLTDEELWQFAQEMALPSKHLNLPVAEVLFKVLKQRRDQKIAEKRIVK